ncbi:hypothetical protein BDV95DRAFT_495891 [Massariosphaeria phaeospora]|uniref:Uncharacterized protein n=1 Tax=Massariosphaeria phaeospora TaxID=100035 RepID=A0A7C8I4G7_9PLEO|nr:hypothetical protein BDV95DRAFT_495891 [Massariosphaeria phaeospora]
MAAPSSFPSDLPPRSQPGRSFKDRHCPGMRGCWSINLASYSLRTSDKAVLSRRACMYTILGLRTVVSIWRCVVDALEFRWGSFAIDIILTIIGFFFIAWCLAQIGDAVGWRRVLGVRVGRWHFDAFLFALALVHVGMFVGAFFFGGFALGLWWVVMWLIIFGGAWVATWAPEPESQV